MAPKLLLDEHLSPAVAHRLTDLFYDVTSVRDRGLAGNEDPHLLSWCLAEGRVICTENHGDFRKMHERMLAEGRDHFEIITVPEWPSERLFRVLRAFLERTDGADMINVFLPLAEFASDLLNDTA